MIDTHTHIYFPEFRENIEEIMLHAENNGVKHFILPNVDEDSLPMVKAFHNRYPLITSMAVGLHPTEVKEDWEIVIKSLEIELKTGNYIAVGEVGIDLYWDKTFHREQSLAFEKQLELAQEYGLPVIIHSRSALEETIAPIKDINPSVPLIFHSFTGSKSDVERIREICNPYFGINGVVTYKNAPELREALPIIGIDKILLETDSPYLTPVPHRGKRNDSSFLIHIRDKVAECLQLSPEDTEYITDNNARQVFGI